MMNETFKKIVEGTKEVLAMARMSFRNEEEAFVKQKNGTTLIY